MPGLISVSEFVKEAREDQNSPTTSTFLHRIPQCRDTVNKLDEVRAGFPPGDVDPNRFCSYPDPVVRIHAELAIRIRSNSDLEIKYIFRKNAFLGADVKLSAIFKVETYDI